ncbi:MAG: hypothetical protein Q4D22_03170 [Candidatus Saccharibacteria bacterium]|nr:hypothetical protein [Candidatus Saccharibacteria bacterium]
MNNSKRLTANIIMFIALIALGAAATFTIIDGVNTSSAAPTSQSRSFRSGNGNMIPQMDGEIPEVPSDDGGTPPEMPSDENQDGTNTTPQAPENNKQWRNRRSDAEADTGTEETTSFQLTDAEITTTPNAELTTISTDMQAPSDNSHTIISYLLVGVEFFAMGTIVTYLLLSRFNSYSPKEVVKK